MIWSAMRLSELITKLQEAKDVHGDLEVLTWDDAMYAPTKEVKVEAPEDWRILHRAFAAPGEIGLCAVPEKVAMIYPWVQGYMPDPGGPGEEFPWRLAA